MSDNYQDSIEDGYEIEFVDGVASEEPIHTCVWQ